MKLTPLETPHINVNEAAFRTFETKQQLHLNATEMLGIVH